MQVLGYRGNSTKGETTMLISNYISQNKRAPSTQGFRKEQLELSMQLVSKYIGIEVGYGLSFLKIVNVLGLFKPQEIQSFSQKKGSRKCGNVVYDNENLAVFDFRRKKDCPVEEKPSDKGIIVQVEGYETSFSIGIVCNDIGEIFSFS